MPLDRLSVAADPDMSAADPDLRGVGSGDASHEVTAILRVDPDRDLAWLEAPGAPSCATTSPEIDFDQPGTVIGIRERNGYRPRLFHATIERTISIPGAGDLLLVRIADGGGARTGFLFDDRHRLIGSILPSPSYSDPSLACALAITDTSPGVIPTDRGTLPVRALAATPDLVHATPAGLFARALLLTRHDQAGRAIGLLDEVAGAIGEFEELLLERGVRRFNASRTARAIEDFTRATHLNPRLYLAHYNLGIALGSSGRYEQAADAFERALQIDPDHPRALFQLALAHRAAERPALARRDYDLLTTQDPALAEELRQILGL
jgi:tetratricopeptide (TPR) repeat protein